MSVTVAASFPLLTDKNFNQWLVNAHAKLHNKKLWKYTQSPKPEKDTDDKDWEERSMEAADVMTPLISPSIQQRLKDEDFNNGYKMLMALTKLLQPTGQAQYMRLMRQLFTLSFDNVKNVTELITQLKIIGDSIDATKVELTTDKRTLLALSLALPAHYNSLVQIWGAMPDITAEKAQEMLLEEEHRENEVKESYGAKGLAMRGRSDGLHCSECGKDGHKTTTCWELNPELAPQHLQEKIKERIRKKEAAKHVGSKKNIIL